MTCTHCVQYNKIMKQKTIKTKHELYWYIIEDYLYTISEIGVASKDETFKKLLKELRSYVDKKLELSGDIAEIYVTVVQQSEK